MKDGLQMVVCQVLHTDLKRRRDFTGSRTRISDTRSSGISGMAGLRNLLRVDMNPGLFGAVHLRSTFPVLTVALLRSALFVVGTWEFLCTVERCCNQSPWSGLPRRRWRTSAGIAKSTRPRLKPGDGDRRLGPDSVGGRRSVGPDSVGVRRSVGPDDSVGGRRSVGLIRSAAMASPA